MVKIGDKGYLKVQIVSIKHKHDHMYIQVSYDDWFMPGTRNVFTIDNMAGIRKIKNGHIGINVNDYLLMPGIVTGLETCYKSNDMYVDFELNSDNLLLENCNTVYLKKSQNLLFEIKESA